jgi:hypothetical protein
MWRTYRQMVTFLEGTDADTYDAQFGPEYLGNKWVPGCDDTCQGAACGACDHTDLRLRTRYIKAASEERSLDERPVHPVDHTTVAVRLRLKVSKDPAYRFVSNESQHYIIRRAAYRACEETGFPPIAKRTVRLASDPLRYRDRSTGVDYAEFGVTQPVSPDEAWQFGIKLAVHMSPWLAWPGIFEVLPRNASMPRRPVSLWQLELTDDMGVVADALRRWHEQESIPCRILSDSFYAGEQAEDGDAKKHVADMWLVRDRHRYVIRMLLTGQLGPYQAHQVLMGKPSWLAAARFPAERIDFFAPQPVADAQFGVVCAGCGGTIPAGLLGARFDEQYCPRCKDEAEGIVVAGLPAVGV